MLIRFNRKSKAQSTAEYAILLGLVIAAAAAMQIYVKRGLQARAREANLFMGNYIAQANATLGIPTNESQYEPYYINSEFTVSRDQTAQQNLYVTGSYNAYESATTERTGNQMYTGVQNE